jgi:hypothetical protein
LRFRQEIRDLAIYGQWPGPLEPARGFIAERARTTVVVNYEPAKLDRSSGQGIAVREVEFSAFDEYWLPPKGPVVA